MKSKQNKKTKLFDIGFVIIIWIASLSLLLFSIRFYSDKKPVEFSFIDVGQGDSSLIQDGNGSNFMIDGGDEGSGYTLSSYFKTNNIKMLDGILISHFHDDHAIGIKELIESGFPIKSLYIREYEPNSELRTQIIKEATKKGISVHWLLKGDKFNIGRVSYEIIGPSDTSHNTNLNNESAIIKASYGQTSVLFTGDIETEAQRILTAVEGDNIASTIIKIPHHGGKSALYEDFIDACNPKYAFIGVGAHNKYNFPSPETTSFLNKRNIITWRTDFDGTIEVKLGENGIQSIKTTDKRRE